ncbi:MAG: hypothetical protein ACKODZ_10670 [Verrucomicrobiota bacterium]
MRISLPPRPAGAGAKPAGAGATVALPAAAKPPMPGDGTAGAKPSISGSTPGKPPGVPPPATGGAKPATAAPVAVRTVVDTDSAGTALAIAALVASLISFGVVLMSFLSK